MICYPIMEDQDLSVYKRWDKASKETRTLFHELEKLVKSLGSIQRDVFENEINFKCTAAPGATSPVVAYVHFVRGGVAVRIHKKHLSDIEDDFTRLVHKGRYREIAIRDREHIRRAEPLLRAAYDDLHKHGHRRQPLPS